VDYLTLSLEDTRWQDARDRYDEHMRDIWAEKLLIKKHYLEPGSIREMMECFARYGRAHENLLMAEIALEALETKQSPN
jgi:hypothetical protein